MKKGDLSINIVVVAAIAMVILVIISVLIFRTGSNLTEGTSCQGLGQSAGDAICIAASIPGGCASAGATDGSVFVRHPTARCPPQEICCVKQGSLFQN